MNSNLKRIKKLLHRYIKNSYEDSSGTEIYCSCPLCGEKRPKFYIHISSPFPYHCFLCNESGVLNSDILNKLGIHNDELIKLIIEENKNRNYSNEKYYVKSRPSKNRIISDIMNINTQNNLKYFNERFGTSYNIEELNKLFKCTCNIPKFLKDQKIYDYSDILNINSAIGFLSADKTYLICRDTSGLSKQRYFNIKLEKNNSVISRKTYNITSPIDIIKPKINLVITEGIFDIIGIYLAKYKDMPKDNNYIFAAACGKSFDSVIQYYASLGFLDMNIEIYSDQDVDIDYYRHLKNKSWILQKYPIKVYYNTLSKDTGVTKDQIKLICNTI